MTRPAPHADTDSAHLASAISANQRMAEILRLIVSNRMDPARLNLMLAELAVQVSDQYRELVAMQAIRDANNKRRARRRS